jgi:hypothetical protein
MDENPGLIDIYDRLVIMNWELEGELPFVFKVSGY